MSSSLPSDEDASSRFYPRVVSYICASLRGVLCDRVLARSAWNVPPHSCFRLYHRGSVPARAMVPASTDQPTQTEQRHAHLNESDRKQRRLPTLEGKDEDMPGGGDNGIRLPPIHFCDDTNEPEDACNAQWLLLWSYAAYAPTNPTILEQDLLRTFFAHFPDQCTTGAAANCYTQAVREHPPRVEDRRELMLWLCMVENQCRAKLGASFKRCRYTDLVRRWRYEDGYI